MSGHRYEELDRVYAAHPEIKALVRAAADVMKAAYATYPLTEESMTAALNAMKKAGVAVDNRDWLK